MFITDDLNRALGGIALASRALYLGITAQLAIGLLIVVAASIIG